MPKGQQSESETLDEKIKRIRKKNEEIEKRRLEVEADKQTAAKLNALVQLSAPKDWPPPREYTVDENPKRSGHEKVDRYINFNDPTIEGSRPPPDPVYRFLADAERDPVPVASNERNLRHRNRLANKVRSRESKNRVSAPQGTKKLANYETWRAERNQIDQERINRQRTAAGQWRREWDNEKSEEEWKALKNEKQKESSSVAHTTPSCGTPVLKSQQPKGPSQSYNDRNVKSSKSSIQISFSNDTSSVSMRVMPKRTIGSGRVGPYQKRRVSFEDNEEKEGPNSCEFGVNLEVKHDETFPTIQPGESVEKAKPSQAVESCDRGQEEPKPRRYKEPRSRKRGAGKREALVARRRLPAPGLEQPGSHLPQAHEPDGDESWEDADSDGVTSEFVSVGRKVGISLNSDGTSTKKDENEVNVKGVYDPNQFTAPPLPNTTVDDAQIENVCRQADGLSFNTSGDKNFSRVDITLTQPMSNLQIEQTEKSALETSHTLVDKCVNLSYADLGCTQNLTAEPSSISPPTENLLHTAPVIPSITFCNVTSSETEPVHFPAPECESPEGTIQPPAEMAEKTSTILKQSSEAYAEENFQYKFQSAGEDEVQNTNKEPSDTHGTSEQTAPCERVEDCSQTDSSIDQETATEILQNQDKNADNTKNVLEVTSTSENVKCLPGTCVSSKDTTPEESASTAAEADTSVGTTLSNPQESASVDSDLSVNCAEMMAGETEEPVQQAATARI